MSFRFISKNMNERAFWLYMTSGNQNVLCELLGQDYDVPRPFG